MLNLLWQKPKSWPRIKVILQPYSTRSCHLDCKPFHTSPSSKRPLIFTISLYFQIDYLFPYSQALQIIFPCSQHTLSLCLTNWFKSFSSSLLFNLSYNLWIYTSVPFVTAILANCLSFSLTVFLSISLISLTISHYLNSPVHLDSLFLSSFSHCSHVTPSCQFPLTASLACRPTYIS